MTEKSRSPDQERDKLVQKIGQKTKLKLSSKKNATPGIWYGLGTMGIIGWSIAVPVLLGAALGIWLDRNYPERISWALTFLLIGLIVGCLNAWHWVGQEDNDIHMKKESPDE
ncbi:MAG: AtpZ/AtpI family protein [Chitinophagaceae bacterium]|nr:AtpZ/AtpI family protein [Oligoflexus sp.]